VFFIDECLMAGVFMSSDSKRLVMQVEGAIRDINRQIINPVIPELKVADLNPVMSMVARARASYLQCLFDLANATPEGLPSQADVESLQQARSTYEALLHAAQALQTAIEREYLDVNTEV
jgi:hypothetical protein